jgi:hypothetical protein
MFMLLLFPTMDVLLPEWATMYVSLTLRLDGKELQ